MNQLRHIHLLDQEVLALDHLLIVRVDCVEDGNVDRLIGLDLVAHFKHESSVARVLLGNLPRVLGFFSAIVFLVVVFSNELGLFIFFLNYVFVALLQVFLQHRLNGVHFGELKLQSQDVLRVNFHAVKADSIFVVAQLLAAGSTLATIYLRVVVFAATPGSLNYHLHAVLAAEVVFRGAVHHWCPDSFLSDAKVPLDLLLRRLAPEYLE